MKLLQYFGWKSEISSVADGTATMTYFDAVNGVTVRNCLKPDSST